MNFGSIKIKYFLARALKVVFALIILFSTLNFAETRASNIKIEAEANQIKLESTFEVKVALDTENEEINAVDGKLYYPKDLLELKEINYGDSLVTLWIERPHKSDNLSEVFPQEISFTGITPGGFNDKNGNLFTLRFKAKKEGNGSIEIKDLKVLLNDGKGTATNTNLSIYSFSTSNSESLKNSNIDLKDSISPESFSISISQNKNVYDNKYFVVFYAQDKQSGIDHYEILETKKSEVPKNAEWTTTESPALLKDQKLQSYIFVKAVDKSGNTRIAKLSPQNYLLWYQINSKLIIGILTLIGSVVIIGLAFFFWKRHKV